MTTSVQTGTPTDPALGRAETILARWAPVASRPEPNRLDVPVPAEDVAQAAQALGRERWGYLAAITGLDHGPEADRLEALYHFCSGAAVLTLRALLPRHGGTVPSVAETFPLAMFFERELSEMFGVTVAGTPDPSRLFLPDDWPTGVYPLLKDVNPQAALAAQSETAPPRLQGKSDGDRFIVPIGPQHPALKEPGHFAFEVDGEVVKGASVRLGYVHRGIEKACEGQTWVQNLYLLERVCGICSHTHATCYALGVERLAGVEAPPRAQAIRVILGCLERIHSHLLWLGVAAHEAGFETLFMYSWRDRETIMDLLEQLSGNRVNYSCNVLGGVKFDISAEQAQAIRRALDFVEERTRHYLEEVSTDTLFLGRTQGIGVLSRQEAEYLGTVGPTARASGVPIDIRVTHPYAAYRAFPAEMVLDTAGDLTARFVVRMKEVFESGRVIRSILDNLPAGDLTVKMPRRIKPAETISRYEAPRGEVFYFLRSNGSDTPERVHIRTPSLCNWTSVLTKAVGAQLADVPLLLAGMDPCFSCNDRTVVITRPRRDPQVLSWEALRSAARQDRRR